MAGDYLRAYRRRAARAARGRASAAAGGP
jgi:hypothetical protein